MTEKIIPLQRKDQDGVLAAQQGINVPRIIPIFEEAKKFVLQDKGSIIARTEHPTEVDGLSGLNYSHVITPEKVAMHETKGGLFASFRSFDHDMFDYMARWWHKDFQHTKAYCRLFKVDPKEYLGRLEHSFWEYVQGYNVYVFGDPVNQDRFHVFSQWPDDDEEHRGWATYDLFEVGKILSSGHTPPFVTEQIGKIIDLYQKVQEVFGSEMCWVVEMQLAKSGELYFLQRSIGLQATNPEWSLTDTSDNKWEFKVGTDHGFGQVIGITPEEGVETDVILERGTRLMWLSKNLPTGVLSSHIQDTVIEQESLKNVAVYIETYHQGHGESVNDPHSSIIPMTRAPLYLHMPKWHDVMPPDLQAEIDKLERQKQEAAGWIFNEDGSRTRRIKDWSDDDYSNPDRMVRLKLNIRSDGSEARVRVLEVF